MAFEGVRKGRPTIKEAAMRQALARGDTMIKYEGTIGTWGQRVRPTIVDLKMCANSFGHGELPDTFTEPYLAELPRRCYYGKLQFLSVLRAEGKRGGFVELVSTVHM